MLQAGDPIRIETFKADGTLYRSWTAVVERTAEGLVCTVSPAGTEVESNRGRWVSPWAGRSFYWLHRAYNLIEIFDPAGALNELYVHIAGLPRLEGAVLRYTDHELDVVLKPGGMPEIIDEHDFAAAAAAYGYSDEFQAACYATAREAAALLASWVPGSMPRF